MFKFKCADRMSDVFHRVADPMSKIVHWINAPLVTRAVVADMLNTIHGRVSHVHVGRSHVNLCTQCMLTINEFASPHAFKKRKVFVNISIAIGAVFAYAVPAPSVFACFFWG